MSVVVAKKVIGFCAVASIHYVAACTCESGLERVVDSSSSDGGHQKLSETKGKWRKNTDSHSPSERLGESEG